MTNVDLFLRCCHFYEFYESVMNLHFLPSYELTNFPVCLDFLKKNCTLFLKEIHLKKKKRHMTVVVFILHL